MVIDTNIEVDLVLTYHDALKFNLVPTDVFEENTKGFTDKIVLMFPPIKIYFALRDEGSTVVENKTYAHVWVHSSDIDGYERISDSITAVPTIIDTHVSVPVNKSSPIKYSSGGAVLGRSGANKLRIKFVPGKDEIFFEEEDDEII